MAKSRCVPTALMLDPDYMELESDTQVILLMLILSADDEGRGQAHLGMMSRHFNKSPETIEGALATLAELELVTCYVVGRHRYYSLLRWSEWQTLSKPTPSRFPQPPALCESESCLTVFPRETQETPGEYRPEGEGKGKRNEQNAEEKAKEEDVNLSPGMTGFPHLPAASADADVVDVCSATVSPERRTSDSAPAYSFVSSEVPIQQVAKILHLPVTESLIHLVNEYISFGSLTLLGEADAAREWIDDHTRNRYNAPMTVAFFQRWLKRVQEWKANDQVGEQCSPAQPLVLRTNNMIRAFNESWRGELQYKQEPSLHSLMHLAEEDAQARKASGW